MTHDGWEGAWRPVSPKNKRLPGAPDGDAEATNHAVPDLESCPVRPLGKRGMHFYYFTPDGELVDMHFNHHNRRGLSALFGGKLDWCKQYFTGFGNDGNPRPGSWSHDRLGDWLMSQCMDAGLFDASAPVRGPGIWRNGTNDLIVHSGDFLADPTTGEGQKAGQKINGVLYPAAPRIERPAPHPMTADVGQVFLRRLQLWNFQDPLGPELLCGFVGSAALGGAPKWRAHVLVRAKHGAGKTALAEFVAAVLGAGAHPMQNNFTEPGLRQALTGEARTLVLDEAEATGTNSRVRKVIEMLRHMSGGEGSRALRGTPGGKALGYQVTGCAYLSAILPPILEPQDRSRITILDLAPIKKDETINERQAAVQDAIQWASEISAALRCRALHHWGSYQDCLAKYRKALLAIGCDMRQADQLGTLLAGRDLLTVDAPPDDDSAEAEVGRLQDHLELLQEQEEEGEGEQCLTHLYSHSDDHWRSGDRQTIAELVMVGLDQAKGREARDTLGRIGLVIKGYENWQSQRQAWLLVANRHNGLDRIFRDTRWAGGSWQQALRYLDDSKPWGNTRFAGAQSRATALPGRWFPSHEPMSPTEQQHAVDSETLAEG